MARFYGTVEGSAKTIASRMGSPRSGIMGHIRGWNTGVEVRGWADGDEDVFAVYTTRGSNDAFTRVLLGEVRMRDGLPAFVPAEA